MSTVTVYAPSLWRSFDGRDFREGMAYEVWHALSDWLADHGMDDITADEATMRVRVADDLTSAVFDFDCGHSTFVRVAYDYDGAPDARPHCTIYSVQVVDDVRWLR